MNADDTMTDTLPIWKKRKELKRGTLQIGEPGGTMMTQAGNTRTLKEVDPKTGIAATAKMTLPTLTKDVPVAAGAVSVPAQTAMKRFQADNPGVRPIGIDLGKQGFAIGGGNTLRQNPATFDLDTPEHRAAAQARDAEFQSRVQANQRAYGMRRPETADQIVDRAAPMPSAQQMSTMRAPDLMALRHERERVGATAPRQSEDQTLAYNTVRAQQGPGSVQQRDIRARQANLPITDARAEAQRAQTEATKNQMRYVDPALIRERGTENAADINAGARTGAATIRADASLGVAGINTGSHERIAAQINQLGYAKLTSEEKQNALKLDNNTMTVMLQQMGADDRALLIADGVKVGRFGYDATTGTTLDTATGEVIHEEKPAEKPGFFSRLFGGTGTPAVPAYTTRPGANVTAAAPTEYGKPEATPLGNAVAGKKVDAQMAQAFLKQAGGDKNKARQLAAAAGYSF